MGADVTEQPRRLEYMELDDLLGRRDPDNVKGHDEAGITRSIERFGFTDPIELDERTGRLVAGHGRVEQLVAWRDNPATADDLPEGLARTADGSWTVPVVRGWASTDDDEARAYLLAANRLTEAGGWDMDDLAAQLVDIQTRNLELPPGFSAADVDAMLAELGQTPDHDPPVPANPPLAERFVVPPFTVLDGRAGTWQDRKRRWMTLGIRSEVGRDGGASAIKGTAAQVVDYYEQKRTAEHAVGHPLTNVEFEEHHLVTVGTSTIGGTGGISVFDPVLCELAVRWFSPPDSLVFDPFAGGSVRGIVSAALGRRYFGLDLSDAQVAANTQQGADILPGIGIDRRAAKWQVADAATYAEGQPFADLLFSCPPYADLERYSDDPRDLSAMAWPEFLASYQAAIRLAVDRLRPDRFAVWVIGEVRDRRTGHYRGLVPETVRAFADAGAEFHNEAVYVPPIGAVKIMVGRQMTATRRLGKCHQNVLVFVKGDPARATKACGQVDVITGAEHIEP